MEAEDSGRALLRRTYRTTLGLAGLGLLALLQTLRWEWISSYLAGVGMALGGLKGLEWAVPRFYREQSTRETLATVGVILGKYGLIGLTFYLLARWGWLHVPAFLGGFVILQMVLAFYVWAESLRR